MDKNSDQIFTMDYSESPILSDSQVKITMVTHMTNSATVRDYCEFM